MVHKLLLIVFIRNFWKDVSSIIDSPLWIKKIFINKTNINETKYPPLWTTCSNIAETSIDHCYKMPPQWSWFIPITSWEWCMVDKKKGPTLSKSNHTGTNQMDTEYHQYQWLWDMVLPSGWLSNLDNQAMVGWLSRWPSFVISNGNNGKIM